MSAEHDNPLGMGDASGRARLLPSHSPDAEAPRERRPTEAGSTELPHRRKPAEGVRIDLGGATIVFVTVCTKDRRRWLACEQAHRLLVHVWRQVDAWLTGRYVLMPDHLHLFAAPRDLRFTMERWLQYWKSQFTKAHKHEDWVWQAHAFHYRLRQGESYSQKWLYVRVNPLRAGLASDVEAWPYQGEVYELRW